MSQLTPGICSTFTVLKEKHNIMHFKTCQAFIYVFVNIFNEMIDSLSRLYGKGEVITAAGPLVSLKNLYKLLFVWIK